MALTDRKKEPSPVSKSSLAYKTAIAAINNAGVDQVCGKPVGSGKYSSSTSWQKQTCLILQRAGVRFEISNVAPKGGNAGDRIKVIL